MHAWIYFPTIVATSYLSLTNDCMLFSEYVDTSRHVHICTTQASGTHTSCHESLMFAWHTLPCSHAPSHLDVSCMYASKIHGMLYIVHSTSLGGAGVYIFWESMKSQLYCFAFQHASACCTLRHVYRYNVPHIHLYIYIRWKKAIILLVCSCSLPTCIIHTFYRSPTSYHA